jgi:glycerol-3-phosphate dehydrogenase
MTIYGGKYTSYRALCERIGDEITKSFGEFRPSLTHLKEKWISPKMIEKAPAVPERFNYKNWSQI